MIGEEEEDTECVHIVIETEHVIEAVRSHRLLWDPSNDLYTAKEARRRAWNDICRSLMTDWDKFDEHDQNDVERKVQQRWRTARDCFVKARAARQSPAVAAAAAGERATRRDKALRSYSHYDRLSFLEETLRTPGTVSLSRPVVAARRTRRRNRRESESPPPAPPRPPSEGPSPAYVDEDEDEEGTMSVFERRLLATLAQHSPLEKDDEHFFRSLAPMLAVLDHRQKLQFRSSVLEELQRQYRERERGEHVEAEAYSCVTVVGERPSRRGRGRPRRLSGAGDEGEDEHEELPSSPPDKKYRPAEAETTAARPTTALSDR